MCWHQTYKTGKTVRYKTDNPKHANAVPGFMYGFFISVPPSVFGYKAYFAGEIVLLILGYACDCDYEHDTVR